MSLKHYCLLLVLLLNTQSVWAQLNYDRKICDYSSEKGESAQTIKLKKSCFALDSLDGRELLPNYSKFENWEECRHQHTTAQQLLKTSEINRKLDLHNENAMFFSGISRDKEVNKVGIFLQQKYEVKKITYKASSDEDFERSLKHLLSLRDGKGRSISKDGTNKKDLTISYELTIPLNKCEVVVDFLDPVVMHKFFNGRFSESQPALVYGSDLNDFAKAKDKLSLSLDRYVESARKVRVGEAGYLYGVRADQYLQRQRETNQIYESLTNAVALPDFRGGAR